MRAYSTVRDRCYRLVKKGCLLEYSECLAVPVRGGGRSELKDGRAGKCYADSMRYDGVVDEIARVLVLGALLVESRNLGMCG
jgi:hypothetical protein